MLRQSCAPLARYIVRIYHAVHKYSLSWGMELRRWGRGEQPLPCGCESDTGLPILCFHWMQHLVLVELGYEKLVTAFFTKVACPSFISSIFYFISLSFVLFVLFTSLPASIFAPCLFFRSCLLWAMNSFLHSSVFLADGRDRNMNLVNLSSSLFFFFSCQNWQGIQQ